MEGARTATLRCRGSLGVLLAGAVVMTVSACDPGPPSPEVFLLRNDQGSWFVVGDMCTQSLSGVELGAGSDWGSGQVSAELRPTGETSGWFQADLGEGSGGFELAPGSTAPESLAAPFFVRLRTKGGVWAAQSFDHLPEAGRALSTPDRATAGGLVDIPVSQIPDSLSDCPDVVRGLTPGAS